MARPGKPWYRASKDAWYANIGGKLIRLCKGREAEAEAESRYKALVASEGQRSGSLEALTVAALFDAYCERTKKELEATTVKRYGIFLRSFAASYGSVQATAVKKHHVEAWVKANDWSDSTEATAKATLISAYQWGIRQDLICHNPLKGIRKPALKSRGAECLITDDEHEQIMAEATPALRLVLTALRETGARPGEVLSVEAKDFDAGAGVWILHKHKTSKATGKPRIIILTPALVTICEAQAIKYPTGPLFRSSRGNAWKAISVSNRVLEIRKRLKMKGKLCPYSYRHTLATDALEKGMPDAHVAALLGHTSTAMVHRHYGHLTARTRTLREALAGIRPDIQRHTPPDK